MVRVKLTQSLGLVTDYLVDETTSSLDDIFGDVAGWQSRQIKQDILQLVVRLYSRVFLGKEVCRNERWLQISKDYTVDTLKAANLLRLCPSLLRPSLFWFIPACTRLRKEVRDANRLIDGDVERRRKYAEACLRAAEKPPKAADAISWMVECAHGRKVDYVAA